MDELVRKANTLIEALPYIREFYGKTIVIKYGGSAMADEQLKHNVMQDVVLMRYVGMSPVIVHGGGPQISAVMERMGKESEFVQGLRVTDAETVDIAEMVLAGSVNKQIVSLINRHGGRAVGLCGKDANLIQAEKHYARLLSESGEPILADIGFVGNVVRVHSEIVHVLASQGFIPVIAPNGVDEDGQTYNINADTVAGEVAAALQAEKLILLTDVRGILRDKDDESTLIPTLSTDDIDDLVKHGIISTGMLPKIEACRIALEAGVSKAHIIDGRVPHVLLLELFTDSGIGTMIAGMSQGTVS